MATYDEWKAREHPHGSIRNRDVGDVEHAPPFGYASAEESARRNEIDKAARRARFGDDEPEPAPEPCDYCESTGHVWAETDSGRARKIPCPMQCPYSEEV